MYSALAAARRKPFQLLAGIAALSAIAATFAMLTLMSNGRRVAVDDQRRLDAAGRASILELRQQLRPKLTLEPRLKAPLQTLDAVSQKAEPPHTRRTFWYKIWRYLFPEIRLTQR